VLDNYRDDLVKRAKQLSERTYGLKWKDAIRMLDKTDPIPIVRAVFVRLKCDNGMRIPSLNK